MQSELANLGSKIFEFRQHLHRYPELSGQEYATTEYLSDQLSAEKIEHQTLSGGCGIITKIFGNTHKPAIALRAEIDALPIDEATQVAYRSQKPGVMHACGHDAHTAIVLATTIALHRLGSPPFAWRSFFQTSEEIGNGALEMINNGALDGVGGVIAVHVDPNRDVGKVGITPGPRTSFCQDLTIEIIGRGGHAARPHTTVDPIATAAHLITLIYASAPRRTDSRDPLVVSFGAIQGGHASNVIPGEVKLEGTIRSAQLAVGEQARELIQQLCAATAQSFGAAIRTSFRPMLPGVINDPILTAVCTETARALLGRDAVETNERPSMGAEDFAEYTQRVPGCMIALGSKNPGREITPLHTPQFDIDEGALTIGARLLGTVVSGSAEALQQKG
ncbi:MAG: amidohydrolase [Verrucomicrobia bacterium]|nr:amidohydrolase [Verrucomicrobiota bacterium]